MNLEKKPPIYATPIEMTSIKETNRSIKIAIPSYGFIDWGGGIDFIRHMLSFLEQLQKPETRITKILLLPKTNAHDVLKKILYPYLSLIKQFIRREKFSWKTRSGHSLEYLQKTYSNFTKDTIIVTSGTSLKSQLSVAIELGSDIVFPCIDVPPDNFRLPWIGYIPDFQHHHLPNFFSSADIQSRNKAFLKMLNSAKHIVVYGKEVIRDADRFYPGYSAKLHALPFCPYPQKDWIYNSSDVMAKFDIKSPYFLISNQFWVHKDHSTAFRAFAKYCQEGGSADLVCTGEVLDYRFPGYFGELLALLDVLQISRRVRILGHIPKIDQVSLIKDALAVVQTTLFEGAPGGGASYDAVALGTPIIASNIAINLEIDCGDVIFFQVGNYEDLTRAMHSIHKKIITKKTNDELWNEGVARKSIISNSLLEIIKQAM